MVHVTCLEIMEKSTGTDTSLPQGAVTGQTV